MTAKGGRGGHEKSTNGCKTCKIRRVKCDETYPECDRCTLTGRRCDGPIPRYKTFTFVNRSRQHVGTREADRALSIPPNSQTVLRERNLSRTPQRVSQPLPQSILPLSLLQQPYDERRAFSFFVNFAAPQISGIHDVYFWGQIVPQMAHHSEAVWNAVISFANLWEHPLKDSERLEQNPNKLNHHQIQALKWYDRAIRMQQITCCQVDDIVPVLTCTLFASIEMEKRNFVNGFTMIRLGFAMVMRFLTVDDKTYSSPLKSALVHHYMRSACLVLTSKLEPSFDLSSFSDVTGAKAVLLQLTYALYGLIKETYYTLRAQSFTAAQLCRRKSFLTSAMLQLKQRLDSIVESGDHQVGTMVGIEHVYGYVHALGLWLGDNTGIANSIPESEDQLFSDIINKAQSLITNLTVQETSNRIRPTFFNDIVLLPPLYFTATMTINLDLRHQALDLMAQHTSQKYPEQLHGIVAVDDFVGRGGQSVLLQRFQNQWDETGKKIQIDTYARIVI